MKKSSHHFSNCHCDDRNSKAMAKADPSGKYGNAVQHLCDCHGKTSYKYAGGKTGKNQQCPAHQKKNIP